MIDNIEQDIIAIISDVSGFEPEEITLETNLVKDLEVDSIKAIEIAVAIEKKFKISVRDEDIPNLNTVKQIIDLSKNSINSKEN